jgi:hypothetical protein
MTEVLYQNPENGTIHDITTIVSSAKWKTVRRGTAGSFTFTALPSSVKWEHGGVIRVKSGGRGLFYGYIFKISTEADGMTDITAYDQLRYLKNKNTYVFTGKKASAIIKEIAEDFQLKTGSIADTGYVIPSMTEDGSELFDIMLKALDYTLVNTGKMFYLWDDFGALSVSEVSDGKLDIMLGDGSLATDYSYETSIDGDTYDQIKLLRDNEDTGKRDLYLFKDSGNIARWGLIQYYEKVDEDMNAAQIEQRGDMLLELYNRPEKTFTVDGISDLRIRAGKMIFVRIKALDVNQYYLIEEAEHDLTGSTMTIKLKAV